MQTEKILFLPLRWAFDRLKYSFAAKKCKDGSYISLDAQLRQLTGADPEKPVKGARQRPPPPLNEKFTFWR